MTSRVIALWAEDESGVIGRDNRLPWHLPKELQHFKQTTMNQAILMGRVTFEGMKRRVLPGRVTLVLTHDRSYQAEGVLVVHSVEEALEWFKTQEKDLYIIGGAKVYAAFDGYYDAAIKTVVHGHFEGDRSFPSLSKSAFVKESESYYEADEANAYPFTVQTYIVGEKR
ncbi:dihydrofolate reductase [Streptococcus sp. zg-JUN1979]|uniref:dihydrofolate reductase n=1 Tax=Streptococcus sp. zg-JUN1979 TaxID=3391450 RepID=UPI0039A70305